MLRELAPDLWVATHKLTFYGAPIVTRMTVIRLPDGALFVHGAVPRTPEMASAVDALGPTRWVIAPNRFHHLWAGEWASLPGAKLLGAPGLAKKRRDLRFEELTSGTRSDWSGSIDHAFLEGMSLLNEVVFFHRPSRSLIVTDLFFNYPPAKGFFVRLVRAIEDCDGKFVVPRVVRVVVGDRRALRRSLEPVMAWDFDRIVLAHGTIVETGGREKARAALTSAGLLR